jgi:hypothetical protein
MVADRMSAIENFLRKVWSDDGIYCLTVKSGKHIRNELFDTIEAAASRAASVAPTKDVYFATHTLRERQVWSGDKKKWQVRTQTNALNSQTLFLDIDIGPDDPDKYANKLEAISALHAFVYDTGLPIPHVVNSGYGVHVHWVTNEPMDSATTWTELALKLRRLAEVRGLKFDPECTTDSARILRIPGTYNHKQIERRPVALLNSRPSASVGQIREILEAALEAYGAKIEPAKIKIEGLESNTSIPFDGPPITMISVIEACPQIRRIAMVHGRDSWEPEWYATIGVVFYTDKGREGVHKISDGYPKYDREETDAKIDQWVANSKGPTLCATFREKVNPTHRHLCDECAFFKNRSTPLQAGRLVASSKPEPLYLEVGSEIEIAPPPPPYKFGPENSVQMLCEDKEGKTYSKTIYPYQLYPIVRSSNGDSEYHLWRLKLPHEEWKQFRLPASVISNENDFKKYVTDRGIYPPHEDYTSLRKFMSAYIQSLIKQQAATTQYDHLGWIKDHTEIIMPGCIFSSGGESRFGALSEEAAFTQTFVRKAGVKSEQLRALSFWNDPKYEDQQFYMCAGIGSLLMWMTGYAGVLVNAFGPTGRGKSFALETVCSIFGNPKQYFLNGKREGGTFLGRALRRNMLGSLPFALDEMTNLTNQEVEDVVMGSTHAGKRVTAKNQGSANITAEDVERATVIISTSNTSFYEQLGKSAVGSAGMARVWEMEFPALYPTSEEIATAEEVRRTLHANYGHLGPTLIRAMVEKRDQINTMFIKKLNELQTLGNIRSAERFWFIVGAIACVTCRIIHDLGWVPWDHIKMQSNFIDKYLLRNRGIVVAELDTKSPIALLSGFLDTFAGNVLISEAAGPDHALVRKQVYGGGLFAHIDLTSRKMLVARDQFSQYCRKEGRSVNSAITHLFKQGIVTDVNTRRTLGYKTEYAKMRSYCFEVELTNPIVSDILKRTVMRSSLEKKEDDDGSDETGTGQT